MGNLSRYRYTLRLDNIQRVTPPVDSEGQRTNLEKGGILISITALASTAATRRSLLESTLSRSTYVGLKPVIRAFGNHRCEYNEARTTAIR